MLPKLIQLCFNTGELTGPQSLTRPYYSQAPRASATNADRWTQRQGTFRITSSLLTTFPMFYCLYEKPPHNIRKCGCICGCCRMPIAGLEGKANPSCCTLRPRTTAFPEEKSILGMIHGVVLWADMNAATHTGGVRALCKHPLLGARHLYGPTD